MKIRFLQHSSSNGCKNLSDALKEAGMDSKRLKVQGSSYRGVEGHTIINWGSSDRRSIREGISILNPPEAVVVASDKVAAFRAMTPGICPDYTTEISQAKGWVNNGEIVYCRTLTRASEGRGIVVARVSEEVVAAPLYTKGLQIHREVRAHVFRGEVIDFVQKKKMSSARRTEEGIEEVNTDVRNFRNGWVFAREGITIPDSAKEVAIEAVRSIGLDFGAVDIIITPQGLSKAIEVNTAPGLEGTTVESYKNAILRYVRG